MSEEIRSRLDHPIVDADAHWLGPVPVFLEFLRDEGFTSATLWVLRDNPRARAFYEKAGWLATGKESLFTPSEPPDSSLPKVSFVVTQYAATL